MYAHYVQIHCTLRWLYLRTALNIKHEQCLTASSRQVWLWLIKSWVYKMFLVVTFPGKSSSQVCWNNIGEDVKEYCDHYCCPWPWKISCLGTVFGLCCRIWVCSDTCRTQCCQQSIFFFLNKTWLILFHINFCNFDWYFFLLSLYQV